MMCCTKGGLTALCLIFSLVGCGGQSDRKEYDTHMVQGVVTLDGKPVPGATVTFTPVDNKVGAPATGMTDEQGNYTLTTIGGGQTSEPGSGAVPGEYYVGVAKKEMPGSEVTSTDDPNYGKQTSTYRVGGGQTAEITYIVPKTYENPRESGIKVTVKEGENNLPIKLEK